MLLGARDALKNITLSDNELTELGRIENAVATALEQFRGIPARLEIFTSEAAAQIAEQAQTAAVAAGKNPVPVNNFYVNPTLLASVDHLIMAFKYRRQAQGWSVDVMPDRDAYGQLVGYVLTLEPSFDACMPEPAIKDERKGSRYSTSSVVSALPSPWFGEEFGLPAKPMLSVIFGTYNRIDHLQRVVASIRRSARRLDYEVIVCDGGSTDGSRAWLAEQPDVVLVGDRHLDGAVTAFNQCYALVRGEFIANLNDDCVVQAEALADGVRYLQEHPKAGQVAFGFRGGGEEWHINEIYEPKTYPSVTWPTTYANFGITRRTVADQVATITGGFWNPAYRTYAADCELSAWIWWLGHRVDRLPDARVIDTRADDELRVSNNKNSGLEAKRMYARWPAESFKPGGKIDPRVSKEELERARAVRDGKLVTGTVKSEPDLLAQIVEMVGWPHPGEERRLRKIAQAIRPLDPVEERFPKRADALSVERVLHVSMGTDVDPQAGQVRALKALGSGGYKEIRWYADYGESVGARQSAILDAAQTLRPSLVFMQLQSKDAVDAETIVQLRGLSDPGCVILSWNGDIASENSPWSVDWQSEIGRVVDLVGHSSMSHVRALRSAGSHTAFYAQIGYDDLQYRPNGNLSDTSSYNYDVAFLGSYYSDGDSFAKSMPKHDAVMREQVVRLMHKEFGERLGLFGRGWIRDRDQIVPLSEAHTVYWKSKIGLNVSLANFLECYTSDRLHRIIGSGALLLTKSFPAMSVFGLKHGENCLIFETPQEAVDLARRYASKEMDVERLRIASAGAQLARDHHSWDVRALELIPYIDAVRSVR